MLKAQAKTAITKSPCDTTTLCTQSPGAGPERPTGPEPTSHGLAAPSAQPLDAGRCVPRKCTFPPRLSAPRDHARPLRSPRATATRNDPPLPEPLPRLPQPRAHGGSLTRQRLCMCISSKTVKRKEGRIKEKKQDKGEGKGSHRVPTPRPPRTRPSAPSRLVPVSPRPANARPGVTHPIPSDRSTGFSSSMSTWKALFTFW